MNGLLINLQRTLLVILHLGVAGVRDACSVHRCYSYCRGSKAILGKVCQCFVLNGVIFYGSIELLDRALRPAFRALLGRSLAYSRLLPPEAEAAVARGAERALVGLFHALWLAPVYLVSFLVNCIWCNDLARLAAEFQQQHHHHHTRKKRSTIADEQQQQQQWHAGTSPQLRQRSSSGGSRTSDGGSSDNSHRAGSVGPGPVRGAGAAAPAGGGGGLGGAADKAGSGGQGGGSGSSSTGAGGGAVQRISEELYRTLLFLVFYVQIVVAGFVPRIGAALNFALTSWLYAYYCFDYGWGLRGVPVEARIRGFEGGWSYFLGFGAVCALPAALLPFYKGTAAMSLLFPLCILVATRSDPSAARAAAVRRWGSVGGGGGSSGSGGGGGGGGGGSKSSGEGGGGEVGSGSSGSGGGGAAAAAAVSVRDVWTPSLPLFGLAANTTSWLMGCLARLMRAARDLRA